MRLKKNLRANMKMNLMVRRRHAMASSKLPKNDGKGRLAGIPIGKHVTILVVTTPGKGANPSDKYVFLSFWGSWFGIVSNTFLSWHSKFCLETTNFHVESDEH